MLEIMDTVNSTEVRLVSNNGKNVYVQFVDGRVHSVTLPTSLTKRLDKIGVDLLWNVLNTVKEIEKMNLAPGGHR